MDQPTEQAAWTCPTCRVAVATPFCATCGERPLRPLELTLRGLSGRLVHALTSIDGRVLRTFWRLLRNPGVLTVAYVEGPRKPYVAPFQLFLLANVLFFAVQSLTHINIFGAPLDSHLHHQDWSALAQALVDARLQHAGTTLAAYAPVFDGAVKFNAKALVIVMAVVFALPLALAFAGRQRPFITHVAFALHLYTVLLILFCLELLLVSLNAALGGSGLDAAWMDNLLTLINLVASAAYIYLAAGPAYAASGPWRVVQAALLALAAGAIVVGYRFLLFLITLYTT